MNRILPGAKFAIGQPVECQWDYRGTTLGVVFGKVWEERQAHCNGGYWKYFIKTSPGCDDYSEMESQLRSVKLKPVFNIVRAA